MKVKRKALGKKVRFEIFKRDNFKCQYCGSHPPQAILQVDHIHPVAKGGTNDMDNLVTSCSHCNIGKNKNLLTSVPKSLAEKATEIQEREEQLRAYSEIILAKKDRLEDEAWEVIKTLHLLENDSVHRDWFAGTVRFVDELGFHEVLEAAELACIRKPYSRVQRFKYFCGICWRKIKEPQGG